MLLSDQRKTLQRLSSAQAFLVFNCFSAYSSQRRLLMTLKSLRLGCFREPMDWPRSSCHSSCAIISRKCFSHSSISSVSRNRVANSRYSTEYVKEKTVQVKDREVTEPKSMTSGRTSGSTGAQSLHSTMVRRLWLEKASPLMVSR